MDEINTWAGFGALTKEQLDAYSPEDLEALKTSVADNEAKLADERKLKDEEFVKAKELADNYKTRAEKAEKAAKSRKEEETSQPQLSEKDRFAVIKANVHEDDIDDILEYAAFKKISVSEALKTPIIVQTLADKSEKRTSAEASATRGFRPGAVKKTDDQIVSAAFKEDKLPDKDSDDAERLFWARRGKKKE